MKERRRAARVPDSLTFKIAYEGYDIICDTLNVSSAGLLCRINRKIPPMTKIAGCARKSLPGRQIAGADGDLEGVARAGRAASGVFRHHGILGRDHQIVWGQGVSVDGDLFDVQARSADGRTELDRGR